MIPFDIVMMSYNAQFVISLFLFHVRIDQGCKNTSQCFYSYSNYRAVCLYGYVAVKVEDYVKRQSLLGQSLTTLLYMYMYTCWLIYK